MRHAAFSSPLHLPSRTHSHPLGTFSTTCTLTATYPTLKTGSSILLLWITHTLAKGMVTLLTQVRESARTKVHMHLKYWLLPSWNIIWNESFNLKKSTSISNFLPRSTHDFFLKVAVNYNNYVTIDMNFTWSLKSFKSRSTLQNKQFHLVKTCHLPLPFKRRFSLFPQQ